MANTFSSVPYEKTAQQRSIANRLEPIAIRYWQQGDELRQASQALVNTDVNDAPKFRDACTAVGRVLVATGLAELPAKFSEASARSVGTHWHARYAIGRLLDAALKQNWEVFEETYIWITNAPDSMLLFEEKLLDQLQWLMTQRYVQIAPACYAEAQSIVDESGEVFIALQDPPYYRYPSAGYLTNQASEAVNHWEGFRLGTGFHTSHGYPVRKAKPAIPTEIEQLRQYFDVAVGPGVPEATAVASNEVLDGDPCEPKLDSPTVTPNPVIKPTGGRPRMGKGKRETEEQKALHNLYTRIQNAGVNLTLGTLRDHFKSDKDFKDKVKEAGKTFGKGFFRAAISWIKYQKTSSENVS